jgi:hypothetical protein
MLTFASFIHLRSVLGLRICKAFSDQNMPRFGRNIQRLQVSRIWSAIVFTADYVCSTCAVTLSVVRP